MCVLTVNSIFTQTDRLFIYNSNNLNSIQNNHSAELTNGDIVLLIMEYDANNDPINYPIEGLNTVRNIIIKIDSLGNEYWRKEIFGYNFNNGFTPSTEFFNYNNAIILPFHYNHSESACIYNNDTLSTFETTTNIPATVYLDISTSNPTVLNERTYDDNYLCGGNQLLSFKRDMVTGFFYSFITNTTFNVTFKEKRNISLGLMETDTIHHTFNTSLSLNAPFKTKLDTFPNSSNFLSNSYIYDTDGVLLDSLADEPFTYSSFNENFFLTIKNHNDNATLILRNISGSILKEKTFFNTKIIDAKISDSNEVLILLNTNKVVKTNTNFDAFSEIEYINQENYALKIDFVDTQNPFISNSNSYLISGLIIDKTLTYRNPDKAFIYKGFLSNINKQYVGIKKVLDIYTRIYPNPTKGIIRIETSKDVKINKIRIVSILGKELINISNLKTSNYVVNLDKQTKGIYYMEIRTNRGIKIEKIMVN